MSKYAINPNALPDPATEQAAALDRDRAAIHHFDDDGAGETASDAAGANEGSPFGPRLIMPDPSHRHGDVDVIEARLAALKKARAAKEPKADPPPAASKAVDEPLIASLISALPQPHTVWADEDRADWLHAAESIFRLVYADEPAGMVDEA